MLPFCRACEKNSDDPITRLKQLERESNNYFIAACDTEEICSNAKTEESLAFLILELDTFVFKAQPNLTRRQLLLAIRSLFKCNEIQFHYAFFRQTEEEAKANSFTWAHAVVHFDVVEYSMLKKKFIKNLKFMVRFEDYMLFCSWMKIFCCFAWVISQKCISRKSYHSILSPNI